MKTLVLFRFETGDFDCPFWNTLITIEGEFDIDTLREAFLDYLDDECDDDTYDESVTAVMNASGYQWEFTANGIPACRGLKIIDL